MYVCSEPGLNTCSVVDAAALLCVAVADRCCVCLFVPPTNASLLPPQNESNRVRGRPQYRELKLQGCEAQQAAEAAAYARSWEDSVVLDIFSWQLQSTMTCCTCGRASHAFDSSQELLVAIPPGSDEISVQVSKGGKW